MDLLRSFAAEPAIPGAEKRSRGPLLEELGWLSPRGWTSPIDLAALTSTFSFSIPIMYIAFLLFLTDENDWVFF